MYKEFKKFILKGNVLELAIGIVLGASFNAVVKSIVDKMLMPVIGFVTAGVDFNSLKFILTEEVKDVAGEVTTAEVAISYGAVINTVITFLITAIVLFFIVKAYNASKKKEEEAPAAPPAPTKEEILLGEIRDLLASERKA